MATLKIMKLCKECDCENYVDFIANKTKLNYVNLRGVNQKENIDSVCNFLFNYGAWCPADTIVCTRKKINYVPRYYHNISFVLFFYEEISKRQENSSNYEPDDKKQQDHSNYFQEQNNNCDIKNNQNAPKNPT